MAARIHVRASSSRIAFSFSVLDWVAQLIASSAYCRNWLVSDMTVLPCGCRPPDWGTCAYGTVEVWSKSLTPAAARKYLKSGHGENSFGPAVARGHLQHSGVELNRQAGTASMTAVRIGAICALLIIIH